MNFRAKWSLQDGVLMYENVVKKTTFNCGKSAGITQPDILSFIASEGDEGDLIFMYNQTFLLLKENTQCH